MNFSGAEQQTCAEARKSDLLAPTTWHSVFLSSESEIKLKAQIRFELICFHWMFTSLVVLGIA